MKVYFLAYNPCYLKINGEYLGKITINPRYLVLEKEDLIEFLPKDDKLYSLSITSNDLKYKIDDFYVAIPTFSAKRNLNFKLLFQQVVWLRNSSVQVTVITNGGVTFYIDGLFSAVEELPFVPDNFKAEFINNFLFLSFYCGDKIALYAYQIDASDIKLSYKKVVSSFDFDGTLKTSVLYNFVVPVMIEESWSFERSFTLEYRRTNLYKNPHELNEKLQSLLFFQMLSIDADVSTFLSFDLKNESQKLKEFIGSPIYVTPHFYDLSKMLVFDNEKAHKYSLLYENGLICNIEEL